MTTTSATSAPPPITTDDPPKPIDPADEADLVLPIADRGQSVDAPSSGWCGEAAIQEALLHLGVWAPQKTIHVAGKSKHPDLYSNDIPVALAALGIPHTFYAPKKKGFEAYAQWVRAALDDGEPVIAGVKILPTEHPDWGLDHFVLVVGYGKKGLLVNTTWGRREWVADTTAPGLSLHDAFYAIRLHRPKNASGANAVRLMVTTESASMVSIETRCLDDSATATRIGETTPVGTNVSIAAGAIARFRCL